MPGIPDDVRLKLPNHPSHSIDKPAQTLYWIAFNPPFVPGNLVHYGMTLDINVTTTSLPVIQEYQWGRRRTPNGWRVGLEDDFGVVFTDDEKSLYDIWHPGEQG